MYFLCFSWFSVDGHFFCYCTNTQRVNKLLPPWTVYKRKQSFFLFSFRLKNISSFTTRSLVEQLLQFLFVFFHVPAWNCIVFCRNYSVFFFFFFSIFTIHGGGRKFRTISSLFVWFAHSLTCIHANTFEIDWFPSHLPYAKLPTARFLTFLLFYLRTLCVCGCKFCLFCFLRRQ